MYLADRDIRNLLPELQIHAPHEDHPFDAERQVQPCSIDLRISNVFWRPSRRRRLWRRLLPGRDLTIDLRHSNLRDVEPLRDWKEVVLKEGDVIPIKPGQTIMCRIYERFRLPETHAGKIEGRSSFARLGLSVHCTGDFINPGWGGYMPLQLFNAGPYPLKITPYLSICQLLIVPLSRAPERSYGDAALGSKYVNDNGGPSLWWRDARVRELQARLGERNAGERMKQDIVDTVRFQNPDVLDRFERDVDNQRLRDLESADQLLDTFSRREDRRRWSDRMVTTAAVLAAGGVVGSLFAAFSVVHVILGAVTILLMIAAGFAQIRRDGGYLGRAELREQRARSTRPSDGAS